MTVSTAARRKPRLIGAMADAVLRAGPDREDADDRRQDADGRHDERRRPARGRVLVDLPARSEGGVGQDQGGHQDHAVGLEEVGGHAGAVADVVAHVVGDGGRRCGGRPRGCRPRPCPPGRRRRRRPW